MRPVQHTNLNKKKPRKKQQTTPVLIRGVTYPSAKDAAQALGVHIKTVYGGLNRGKPDSIGLGKGRKPPKPPKQYPIKIGTTQYESLRAAARALGVSRKRVTAYARKMGLLGPSQGV